MAGARRLVVGRVTLEELAALRHRDVFQRGRFATATSHVGALSPAVVEALARAGLPSPTPRHGDPLLLAATETEGSLWRIARAGETETFELGEDARAAWRIAARVAARTLPLVGDPAVLVDAPPPRLARLSPATAGAGSHVLAVNGPSVGLAFALLHVSRAVGVPLAADLACSAEIRPDGTLRPVDRLDRKLAALRAWAPGVRRVLVARGQIVPPDPGLDVVAVADLGAAWARAFAHGDFDAAVSAAWAASPDAAARAADAFYRFVLGEPAAAVRWPAVARATRILLDHTTGDDHWRAAIAHGIAARHEGAPLRLPPLPAGMRVRRPHRLELLAQRVQSVTDTADPEWRALAEEAEAEIAAPNEEHPEDLKVLGALGRLYAAWGRWADAVSLLRRAAIGWSELDREPEASRPLCELLRVAGIAADRALLADAEDLARRCARDPRTSDPARAFLQLAIGRARIQVGDAEPGRDALAEGAAAWTETYVHARASRLRWLARIPDGDAAFATLEALAADPACRDEAAAFWLLARADRGDVGALAGLPAADRALLDRCVASEPYAPLARHLDLFPY